MNGRLKAGILPPPGAPPRFDEQVTNTINGHLPHAVDVVANLLMGELASKRTLNPLLLSNDTKCDSPLLDLGLCLAGLNWRLADLEHVVRHVIGGGALARQRLSINPFPHLSAPSAICA